MRANANRACAQRPFRQVPSPLVELRHLHYFITVAEELSVTRAALKLRLAQPSLTRQIRNLEGQLSVQLFARVNNKLSLTEAGRSFCSVPGAC